MTQYFEKHLYVIPGSDRESIVTALRLSVSPLKKLLLICKRDQLFQLPFGPFFINRGGRLLQTIGNISSQTGGDQRMGCIEQNNIAMRTAL